jgi:hypothetical protein
MYHESPPCRDWYLYPFSFPQGYDPQFGARREKLDCMQNNPVVRGLVSSPADWPWSSWRFYHWEDASVLRRERLN